MSETIICKSAMENCQNPYDSCGMICVGCNCCGRINAETMWKDRYDMAIERLRDNLDKLSGEYFQSKLQQTNICSNIVYWGNKLKEIITHLDFDAEKGENK